MGFFRYIADYFKRDAAAPSNQGAAAPANGNNAGVLTPRQGGVLWPTYAGQTALCVATVYRCVKFIAESVANLNLQCMRLRDGIYVDEKDSRLSYLLNVQPDLALSAFDMWVTAVAYALLKGNAYIVPVYSPITMDIDRFALCGAGTVTHDTYNDTYHVCDVENGIYGDYDESEIIHIKGFTGNDPKVGVSVLTYARLTLDIAGVGDAETYSRFKNGGNVRGIIANDTSQQDALRRGLGLMLNDHERSSPQPWVRWLASSDMLNYLIENLWRQGLIYCVEGQRAKWQTLCGVFLRADGTPYQPSIKSNRCKNPLKIREIDTAFLNGLAPMGRLK